MTRVKNVIRMGLMTLVGGLCLWLSACTHTLKQQVDVLVIGGTTSGASAGIVAARLGSSTLIVEETPMLGGMFSSQGVSACDGNHNLHSGIWAEFRQHLRNHYGGAAALETGWVSNTLFEPHVADSIIKAMAKAEPNLQVMYGYYLVSVLKEGNRVTGALFENQQKDKLVVTAKVTIDATDIGDGLAMAGAAYRLGMDSRHDTGEANAPEQANNIVQDLTWVAVLKDYGVGQDKTIARPVGYDSTKFIGSCAANTPGLVDCPQMLDYGKLPNNKYMINWPKRGNDIYLNVVEMPRAQRQQVLEQAKQQTLQFVYYIQHHLGFKHLGLANDEFATPDQLAYAPYHREGRRLKGLAFLTYNHVAQPYEQAQPLYRTGVSVGDYPVDHHHAQNPQAPDVGFPPVPSFNIPLGSLIPEEVDGLIVADKAISVSNLINGSTRLQPVVLLTGQAAGTLAALAVAQGVQPRQVPVRSVQAGLLGAGAYIMPLFDVSPADANFACIQRIAGTGILRTKGQAYKWANRTWFMPQEGVTVQEFTQGLHDYDSKVEVVPGTELLTQTQALRYIQVLTTGAAVPTVATKDANKPVTRRQLAIWLDTYLKPFDKTIDHQGNYVLR